ncbi:NAD(P)-dependent alcohol dehydrogenase [Pseudomonas sp. NBRC 100443]|uniref:zinc-dependent alcohol dehydrogenase family protein n=1 Tax=Pseudomonas sp. NBRC 100443 TaxID=1113665 RepID=UPI0024A434BB|nr:NAD(P)-dependent alcohol dehydrogenase [Pseudomonas sp. NBRC 100443]GLU37374.1 alcohol dehydrogenase [Pseudomonas sp. NBRC 100443]
MKALTLKTPDGLAGVVLEEIEARAPLAGEVQVALKAASLNHRELWISRGQYPGMTLPCTLGADGAGVVEAVGEGVSQSLIGREVLLYPGLGWGDDPRLPAADFGLLGMPGPGTLAQSICVPAQSAVAKPAFLSFEQAAAIPLAALTAWRGLTTKAALRAGENVLITGVGGGVATFALKFAVAMGARVFVTSGSDETLDKAIELGATAGFNYHDAEWRKVLGKQSGGIDVVFDGAPASSFGNYVRSLRMGARVVVYGSTGGAQVSLNAPDLFLRNISLIGTNVGELGEFQRMVTFIEEHRIEPVIDRVFDLEQSKDALGYLESAHQFGKVVVRI